MRGQEGALGRSRVAGLELASGSLHYFADSLNA